MNKFCLSFCVFVSVLFHNGQHVFAQKKEIPVQAPCSDSLRLLSKSMFDGSTDMIRYEANDRFMHILKSSLRNPEAIDWAFDSVRILSVMSSSDKKFRLFTWTLPLATERFESFGVMLVYSNKSKNYKIIDLQNDADVLVHAEKEVLKKGHWYGAVYYQLIEKKYKGEHFYTLIGWNGADALHQQKVVEILTFDKNDEPVFGKLLFRGKGYYGFKRLIFRYSDKVVMKLRYELSSYTTVTKKEKERRNRRINTSNDVALKTPKKKKRIRTKTEELIVFDQLQPLRPEFEGQYQFYYPLSETGNVLYFEDGRWVFKQITTTDDSTGANRPLNGLMPQ